MAFMGAIEARKSEWSVLADAVYLNVGDYRAGRVPVTTKSGATLPLKADAGVKVKGWVVSLLGGRVQRPQHGTIVCRCYRRCSLS